VQEQPIGPVPFSRHQPPVSLSVQAYPVSSWKAEEGAADPTPQHPAVDTGAVAQTLTLIPYAAAKLRITALPTATPSVHSS